MGIVFVNERNFLRIKVLFRKKNERRMNNFKEMKKLSFFPNGPFFQTNFGKKYRSFY